MSLTSIRYDREQLEQAIKSVEAQFADKIERIRYSVGEDWADGPALFFRVLLKDSPDTQMAWHDELRRRQVLALSYLITDALRSEVHADDLQPYFAFRSVSEQEKLRDPKWD
jgi:hypothetical protein